MNIPDFKNGDDEQVYYDLFDEKVVQYKFLLDKVREELYGAGNGNYANLPGSCFVVLNDITLAIMQDTSKEYHTKVSGYEQHTFSLGDK